MSHYAVIGGMYLPFVTDAIIKMVGPRYKGIGSALVEGGDAIAVLVTSIFSTIFSLSASLLLWVIPIFYIAATILQKRAERRPSADFF